MKEFLIDNSHTLVSILGFVIIAISSNKIAGVFQKIHLPLITGMIFTGILAGPYILNLIPESSKDELFFINEMALAFIAFAAGAELYIKELRSRINSIKWNTFGQLVITFVLGTILMYLLSDFIPFMDGISDLGKLSIAMITATIFVARSPASAIAVISELRAKGPFVQTVMGVTVVKDFLVIILFSICFALAQSFIYGIAFNLTSVLFILLELAISFALGFYVYGIALKSVFVIPANKTVKIILILVLGYTSYLLNHWLHDHSEVLFGHTILIEPLLVCILASFYVTNRTKHRVEFLDLLHIGGMPVYVSFFTLTGATLAIDVLPDVIDVALILFGIRLLTMIIGGYVGGFLAKDPMKYNHLGWMPYVTQAGVALGLMTIVAREFPEWGEMFSTVIIAMIVINQFVGPPIFKWAIFRLGEDNLKAQEPEFDGVRDAIIFGHESQSMALALQLQQNGWNAEIATLKEEGSVDEHEGVPLHYIKDLSVETFESINARKAEAIVGMLSDQENLELCTVAYHHFGTRDIIARLNSRENSQEFLDIGVKIVEPTTAIVNLLDQFVRSPSAASLLLGMEKGQATRDIRIRNKNFHGLVLRDLRLPSGVIVLSIRRGGQSIISHGYTRLRYDDVMTMVGEVKDLDDVQLRLDG
ncbi:MAG: cation:proton antiporter [Cyclobacteriaceae bacterium]